MNTKADGLVGLAASLTIPKKKGQSILVIGMRLLTALLKQVPESEQACNVEIATKSIKDWRTQSLEFLEHRGLLEFLEELMYR